jgi:hypothetical protein
MRKFLITLSVVAVLLSPLHVPEAHASTICDTYATSLTTHLELEEASGTREDIHGPNDFTDNNTVTSGTGKIGTAADFERSTSEYLSITDGTQSGLEPTATSFSINLWANPESFADGNWHGLFSKQDTGSAGKGTYSMGIIRDGVNYEILFSVYGSAGGGTEFGTAEGITAPSLATWAMYTFTYDISTGEKKIYINATLEDTEASGPTTLSDSAAAVRVGWRNIPSGDDGWDGLIDEVSFWNGRVLSQAEITDIYNAGSGISYDCAASPSITPGPSSYYIKDGALYVKNGAVYIK